MKSICINKTTFYSSIRQRGVLNQPITEGASEIGLLTQLANNLSISALAAHSPLSPSVFLFVFVSRPLPLLPSAPGWPQRGGSSPFRPGPFMDAQGSYKWEGPGRGG